MEQHHITWRGIALDVTFTPKRFAGHDHIEIRAEGPAVLPVTDTGYRSHFLPHGIIEGAGGVVAFVTTWLDAAAKERRWSGQLSLF